MTPRQSAIKKFQQFLNKSEASRAMPKPVEQVAPAEPDADRPSDEAMDALRALTQSGE